VRRKKRTHIAVGPWVTGWLEDLAQLIRVTYHRRMAPVFGANGRIDFDGFDSNHAAIIWQLFLRIFIVKSSQDWRAWAQKLREVTGV
jgi:hypothetical protein